MGRTDLWSEDDASTVQRMQANGSSYAEIADAIGRPRNSVAGHLHRLREKNGCTLTPRPNNKAAAKAAAIRMAPSISVAAPDAPGDEPIINSSRSCQYPTGTPGHLGFHFCGAPRMSHKSSYCAEHHALCWNKPQLRKRSVMHG